MIDSRDKRSSALLLTLPWRGQYPVADSTISQADRQHANGVYRGILADPPSAAVYDRAKYEIIGEWRNTVIEGTARQTVIEAPSRNTTIIGERLETEV